MWETAPDAEQGTGAGRWEAGFPGLCKEGGACLSPVHALKAHAFFVGASGTSAFLHRRFVLSVEDEAGPS